MPGSQPSAVRNCTAYSVDAIGRVRGAAQGKQFTPVAAPLGDLPPADFEDSAPGTYAVLFVKASAFAQAPERGDEVTVGNSVYKVVDLEADAAGGILLS